jgi:hypothetical protein
MDVPEHNAQRASLPVHDIGTKAFACIPNCLSLADLDRMQQFVNGTIGETEKNTYTSTDRRSSRFWPGRTSRAYDAWSLL